MSDLTQHLRDRGEDRLVALLTARPDLALPPPTCIRSLAARATNRASLDRALAQVDAMVLAVLEAVLGLEGTGPLGPGGHVGAGVRPHDVATAIGTDLETVTGPLTVAQRLALLWPDADGTGLRAAPGLDEALGPYPAGLGPGLAATLARRSGVALRRLAGDLGVTAPAPQGRTDPASSGSTAPAPQGVNGPAQDAALVTALAAHLSDPGTLSGLLAQAPPGARAVLDALAWGPPVGRSPGSATRSAAGTTPAQAGVEWLLRHGLLSVGDPQHVVLPREVGLALRGGRTHRGAPPRPQPAGVVLDGATVDGESARQAEDIVRLVAGLVSAWGQDPPGARRSGGLSSRDLRRTAGRLDVPEATAAFVVELAGTAGLVTDDGEDPATLLPTAVADDWLALPLAERWATLAGAWLTAERASWLVGTRDERGALRAALDPELRRPWAPRLRTAVLGVLAEAGPAEAPRALAAHEVHDVLTWLAPRTSPPEHAVEAVLVEAAALGVLGAGALSSAGRALLGLAGGPDAATVLAAHLAPAVDDLLLQSDLTGIVPGRPSPALSALLDVAARVESRGAATTVRFTEDSVRDALDTGRTAEALLAELSRHTRTGVPQPLEYLVLDVARRHGRVRVGAASSYLRSEDPTLLAGLAEDRGLRTLGLVRLAPTVLASQAPPSTLLAALRERGLAPVVEDATGHVMLVAPSARRAPGARSGRRPAAHRAGAPDAGAAAEAQDRRLRRLVRDLVAADGRETIALAAEGDRDAADAAGPGRPGAADVAGRSLGTPDPVLALALLREAAAQGREVWLELIGPGGAPTRRRVRPLRVDAGRVRAIDAEREAELTVAVHRIAHVSPVTDPGPTEAAAPPPTPAATDPVTRRGAR